MSSMRQIILDGVRDHIVSSIHGKETPYLTWKALKDLFQNNSDHRKLALKQKAQDGEGKLDSELLNQVHPLSR